MKKFFALLLATVMTVSLTACNNNFVPGTTDAFQTTGSTITHTESIANQTEHNQDNTDTKKPVTLDTEALTDQLTRMCRAYKIAGMAVAVTDGEKIIYSEGFGVDNVDDSDIATSTDSLFRIASISKTFTALMVMCLCDAGVLDLDTPIKNYIPSIQFSQQETTETITLRHLLTHTGGMPADDYMYAGSTVEDTMNDDILSALPTLKLSSLPSEGKYQYSTWGYNVIGCVASVVTGKTLSQLISEYVLDPLGMDATTFDYKVASNGTYPLSDPHIRTDNVLKVDKLLINTAFNAGAGLYSNTADMCKFARFFLNGGVTDSGKRLISEEAFADMMTMHIDKAGDGKGYYGYGVSFKSFGKRYIYGHTGTYYGQNYRCSLYMDDLTGYGVVTLMNTMPTEKNAHISIPEMIFGMLIQSAG